MHQYFLTKSYLWPIHEFDNFCWQMSANIILFVTSNHQFIFTKPRIFFDMILSYKLAENKTKNKYFVKMFRRLVHWWFDVINKIHFLDLWNLKLHMILFLFYCFSNKEAALNIIWICNIKVLLLGSCPIGFNDFFFVFFQEDTNYNNNKADDESKLNNDDDRLSLSTTALENSPSRLR